jgi:hypothetical protein
VGACEGGVGQKALLSPQLTELKTNPLALLPDLLWVKKPPASTFSELRTARTMVVFPTPGLPVSNRFFTPTAQSTSITMQVKVRITPLTPRI